METRKRWQHQSTPTLNRLLTKGTPNSMEQSIERATHILVTIYDGAAKAYNTPYVSKNTETAIRSFADSMVVNSTLSRHPEDFILYQTGWFDELSGDVWKCEPRIKLTHGNELVGEENNRSIHAVEG